MKAKLIFKDRTIINDNEFTEIIIWEVPRQIPPSKHNLKYRLAYVTNGVCQIRFDNEQGKGDHFHICESEVTYEFQSIEKLFADFYEQIRIFKNEHS